MHVSKDIWFTTLGNHFGFPECCVKEFAANYCQPTKELYPEGPWLGTGFVPCPCCAPAAAADFEHFVANRITPNRSCSTPFPDDDDNGRPSELVVQAGMVQLPLAARLRYHLLDNPATRVDDWFFRGILQLQQRFASADR